MIIPSNEFINNFKECPGAFSVCEAIALFNIVFESPDGCYLELGSHKGKSSMVIACAMKTGSPLYLVEPEFKDEEWRSGVFIKISNIIQYGNVHLVADYSLNVIPKHKDLAFCFVDSGVHDDMVMEEVKLLEDRMMNGGVIAFHDFGNQFTAVARAYKYLLNTGKYEKIDIDWGRIFNHVRDNNLEDGNNSWHERGSEEFPKFVGAVRRK